MVSLDIFFVLHFAPMAFLENCVDFNKYSILIFAAESEKEKNHERGGFKYSARPLCAEHQQN